MTAEIALQNVEGLADDNKASLKHVENLEQHFHEFGNADDAFAILEGMKDNLKSNEFNINQLRSLITK